MYTYQSRHDWINIHLFGIPCLVHIVFWAGNFFGVFETEILRSTGQHFFKHIILSTSGMYKREVDLR